MLNLSNLKMQVEPFPHGEATDVFEPATYAWLDDNFPPFSLAGQLDITCFNKFALSDRSNPSGFAKFVRKNRAWRKFNKYLEGPFAQDLNLALLANHICLTRPDYYVRFEFSWLPAGDGFVLPHTDAVGKVVSLVLPFGEWNRQWGGSTDMLAPKGKVGADFKHGFKEFDIVASFPFAPNRANVLLKTHNSWHSVRCSGGPTGTYRKSVTVNLLAK